MKLRELRITIEGLDEHGNVVLEETVCADPEEEGLLGDIETKIEYLLSSADARG